MIVYRPGDLIPKKTLRLRYPPQSTSRSARNSRLTDALLSAGPDAGLSHFVQGINYPLVTIHLLNNQSLFVDYEVHGV